MSDDTKNIRYHSIFYLLYENYTAEQARSNPDLPLQIMRISSPIYDIYAITETLLYLIYKNAANDPNNLILLEKYFKTLLQIQVILAFILNTPYLLSNTYVFDTSPQNLGYDNNNSQLENLGTHFINLNNSANAYAFIVDFVDYLFAEVYGKFSGPESVAGASHPQNPFSAAQAYYENFDGISVFVNEKYAALFPGELNQLALGIIYNYLSNMFNYSFEPEPQSDISDEQLMFIGEEQIRPQFIKYMIDFLFNDSGLLLWYLGKIEVHNNEIFRKFSLEQVAQVNYVELNKAFDWFMLQMQETTTEPNLWNGVTYEEFRLKLNQILSSLQQQQQQQQSSYMPSELFQQLQTEYEKITISFQNIRRLINRIKNPDIKQFGASNGFDIDQLIRVESNLNIIDTATILQVNNYYLPLLNLIEAQIKSQSDQEGNKIILEYEKTDETNEEFDNSIVSRFVAATVAKEATAHRGGKIKTKPKLIKKQGTKMNKKQGTKMNKKHHKKNNKITKKIKRKTNNNKK